ncbi:MAG: hypothetical protein ACP5OO_02030 [Chloroflexia bacterium]
MSRLRFRPGIALAGLPLVAALLAGLLGYVPPAPPVELPPAPPLPVETRNPKLGVHTRLADEPEAWKVERTLEMVHEMGAPWIVEIFPWAYIEKSPGRFDWAHADLVISAAYQQGLSIIARLDIVPAWARPAGSSTRYLERERYADYARYVQAFAARYRERVRHIIIWNEPNTAFEWGGRPPDPVAYTELLCTAYAAVKAVHPEAVVLAAGLAPTVESPEGGRAWDDLAYLQAMYDAGAGGCFDGLAAHAYGWREPFRQQPDPSRVNFRRVELLRRVMERNGDRGKKIYITEAGWNDHPRWVNAVRPAERIAYTLEACRWSETQDWLAVLAFWQFRMPWGGASASVYYNFVGEDFTPRPIYLEVQRYARRAEP